MAPEHAIARVLKSAGQPVGLAFAVGPDLLVTCAHVINAALRRPERESSRPDAVSLLVDFPFGRVESHRSARRHAPREGDPARASASPSAVSPAAPVTTQTAPMRRATVLEWLPGQGPFDLSDIAVLQLPERIPAGVTPIPLAGTDDPRGEVQMWGPSPERAFGGHVSGDLQGAVDTSRLQIDQHLRGVFRVEPGFSGGPVWLRSDGTLAGVLHAAGSDDDATDAYVLSVKVIRAALASRQGGATRRGRVLAAGLLCAAAVAGAGVTAVKLGLPTFSQDAFAGGTAVTPESTTASGRPIPSSQRGTSGTPMIPTADATTLPDQEPGDQPPTTGNDGGMTEGQLPERTTPPPRSPTKSPSPTPTVREPQPPTDVLIAENFRGTNKGWPTNSDVAWGPGGYRLSPENGARIDATAPDIADVANVRIVVTAAMVPDSEGGWGVWCRGDRDNKNDRQRYAFAITHNKAGYISTPPIHSPWQERLLFDRWGPTTITAECTAGDRGSPSTLDMAVNVDRLPTMRHSEPEPIRAGSVGIYAYADDGKPFEVVITSFKVYRL